MNLDRKFEGLTNLIGHTPLLEIALTYKGSPRTVYAKAEHYNITGSIKDRIALHILKKGYDTGTLDSGYTIVEATSGNTGIAFSALGAHLGLRVRICMPDWMSAERKKLIKSYGAEIDLVSKEEGGFRGSISRCGLFADSHEKVFLPNQFSNEENCRAHYASTGPEIWEQLTSIGLQPDGFVAGVGTGGTIMGVGAYLRSKNPAVKLYPMEPANSPTLSTGYKVGRHRIEGISDEFIPPILKLNDLHDIIHVDDGDAIIMAQKIASQLGIGVGISSGANLVAALMAQDLLGPDKVVTTVFSDDSKKYLSTDLMNVEPVKDGFYSVDTELLSVRAIR